MRIDKRFAYAVLLYGTETWTKNVQLESQIYPHQMWINRRKSRFPGNKN